MSRNDGFGAWVKIALALAIGLAWGCNEGESSHDSGAAGTDSDTGGTDDDGEVPQVDEILPDPDALGVQGVRRLSRSELRWVILDLLGMDPGAELDLLPTDELTPFDNDYTTQFPSEALVTGYDAFANNMAQRVVDDPLTRDSVVGCQPQSPTDAECFGSFVAHFGRLVIRRPLTDPELAEFSGLLSHAETSGDFYVAVRMAIHVLLQDVEFIYRHEIGKPVAGEPNLLLLSDYELASRLSFLLWGSSPDDELLDLAEGGELSKADDITRQAARMLDDPRAAQQLERLHAQWLSYETIPAPGNLPELLADETGALLRRVVLEERLPWLEIFTFPETFVDAELASHYGLTAPPGEADWVAYGPDGRRGGILSHGSYLSGYTNFGDTSPVLRGRDILSRLLCREIPPPPPDVNAAEPPEFGGPDACKFENFAMRDQTACAPCHGLIDNIGFGLENYGPYGEWRAHEPDRPDCPITGEGALDGVESFNGAAQLGELLAESGEVEGCFVDHYFRFAVGRPVMPQDAKTVAVLRHHFEKTGTDFADLLLALASSEAFRYRIVEQE